jgi:hypothetical protein
VTTFKQELRKYPGRGGAIKSILRRWLDDDRADEVWRKISAADASLAVEDFIRLVIRTGMAARALPARLEARDWKVAAVIAGYGPLITKALASNKSPSEIAEVLENAAWELRFIEDFAMLDGYPLGTNSRRRDKRSRRAFSLAMVDFFHERCGKWMDGEAGVLLEIVLPSSTGDSLQEVRDYRKDTGRLDRKKQV